MPRTPLTRTDKGRVLVADDSSINRMVTRQMLEQHGYTVETAETGEEALERLAVEEYDMLCLDVALPGIDGLEVCQRLRQSTVFGHMPVLMVSASFTEEENVVKGLEAGANDYVRIPFSHIEFLARVDSLVRLKLAEDKLRALSLEDPLTHLGNRARFFSEGPQEMARAARHNLPLCLGLLDIDRFKEINDTHGHQAGDDVLCGVAALIRENVRKEDSAFRWGGDEFAILLVETDARRARRVADRILQQIESTDFSLAGKRVHTTVSIGLGQYDPKAHTDLDAFLMDVDKALYRAKRSGRDRIVLTR